ncbi:MAG: DUF4012 domain-containing protein [Chloroflexota bacterium]
MSGHTTAHKNLRSSAFIRVLFSAGILLLVAWLVVKSWRIGRAVQSLQARQEEAAGLLAGGISTADPDGIERLVLGARGDVVTLVGESRPFITVAPSLKWLPEIGPSLAAAPVLLEMADAGTLAVVHGWQAIRPAWQAIQSGQGGLTGSLPALLEQLDRAQPDLALAGLALQRVAAARASLTNVEQLPGRLQSLLGPLDEWLPFAQQALRAAPSLPAILGRDGPRTYLIIAQNEDEVRPTGGFISGVGLLVLDRGQIASLEFRDAYTVDNWRNQPYDLPPEPMFNFMGLELFTFRDSNFWPDFPTSAEKAIELYEYGQGVRADGVLALDQQFLVLLISAIGPLPVAELETTLTGDTVIPALRQAWREPVEEGGRSWIQTRKSFMGPVAAAIRGRLESDLASLDLVNLARTLLYALDTKHLQLYVREPAAAAVLSELGWDGRLANPGPQDVLMVVETNMGYNKTNAVVGSSLNYDVTLTADGSGRASLFAHYLNSATGDGRPCQQGTLYTPDVTYETLTQGCYWNYLRVYAPAGSQLLEASNHPAPADAFLNGRAWAGLAQTESDSSGLAVFSNFLLLPMGESASATFTYQLPETIVQPIGDQWQYQLTVHKQAGLRPQPTVITVQLPAGAQFVAATPDPAAASGQQVTFQTWLEQDTSFSLVYALP